jgi:hypothetical protein
MPPIGQNIFERFLERPPSLAAGLRLDIEPLDDGHALLLIEDGERRFRARAAGLAVPYPSGLQRLIATDSSVEVVLVERASSGLEHAAAQQGIGVLDLRGRGHLRGPGFVYVVSPHDMARRAVENHALNPARREPDPLPRRAASVSAFAPKASRVVRALLSAPRAAWRVTDLANRVGMNPGNVHRVLVALGDLALVERDRDGYIVSDPGSLLEAWAEQWRGARKPEPVTVLVGDELRNATDRILASLDGAAAISGELAAELYAPHLPAAHAIIHCTDPHAWDPERLAGLAGLPPLRARHRITVDLPDPGVRDFSDVRDGLPLVSPQQLYVDLYRDRGRGREAAEHVRREVLGF